MRVGAAIRSKCNVQFALDEVEGAGSALEPFYLTAT